MDAPGPSDPKISAGEIEALFDGLSAQPPVVCVCKDCGSEMLQIDTVFFLSGNERGWKLPLPVCPKCDKGLKDLKAVCVQAA
jgi:hypothetical protein